MIESEFFYQTCILRHGCTEVLSIRKQTKYRLNQHKGIE